ncbi:MAG: polynucleotide adenylyltransferase PcnB [endosymbiont of Galathealinum brachiosum]|uniref:Poly(A) polymerase I n=1 Tax=endosymbiont of Galathealinum brachiosum TaxID=2200906 RepID=A0A370D8L0_9GAMM|nr:MAG: polynucleotide adenylyltransferase PcnB [endosymbiont of Galathealinum brachiosum]
MAKITQPKIIPRPEHAVSRDNIDDTALKVLYRLHKAGYRAMLVGGGVRDLLLGHAPKDFDIATDALPEDVKKLFSNSRLIGRRFRLAHVFFGRDIIEVATFRASQVDENKNDIEVDRAHDDSGRILRDNVYGQLEDDVWRRDFTVNALYYDIADFSIVDYTSAMDDIKNKVLQLIGDPQTRYREDPVRMLRAIRFAAKLGFTIHHDSEQPIFELGHLLADIPPARLYDEVLKLFHSGQGVVSLQLLRKYDLLQYLFKSADDALKQGNEQFETFIHLALESTDKRINQGKPVTPAFLFAAMLWAAVDKLSEDLKQSGEPGTIAMQNASSMVLSQQVRTITIPKRFSMVARDIWQMQHRFKFRHGRRAKSLLMHKKFRAAYDFMCIRSKAGEVNDDSCEWWTRIQTLGPQEQDILLKPAKAKARKKKTASKDK